MSEWVVQVAVIALFSLACGALVAAWMRAELRDANSFATCTTGCTTVHYVVAVAFIAAPLLIALAGLAMIVARGSRWRLGRTRENHG